MFTGRLSILKDFIYLMILGLHAFLFAYFIYTMFPNYVFTIIPSLSIASLIILALYSFLTTKPYYFYFFIGIIISSVPLLALRGNIFFDLSAILIIPEVIILVILLFNGLEQGSVYYKMRVNKKDNVFHHDPAVTHLRAPVPMSSTFRMDEVWNPDSSFSNREENEQLEKKTFSVKMQLLGFLLTIVSLGSFIIFLIV